MSAGSYVGPMSKNEKKIRAWHFSGGTLGYDDGRKVEAGVTYSMLGSSISPELCCRGMHASIRPIDAIKFRKGCIVSRVELWGGVQQGGDKIVARHRKVLWCADATEVLRKFARMCALDVVHLWEAPDTVLKYLKTGDESLRAKAAETANDAAYAAHAIACATYSDDDRAAAAYAAAAASSAAHAANYASYAAYNAADVAYDADAAASAAAYADAAYDAQRKKQNDRLYRMLMKLKDAWMW